MIEGRVVEDTDRVEICIKGTVLGFPATLEAIRSGFPFGVTYFIETKVIDDPSQPEDDSALKLTLSPRFTRGIYAFFARLLLLEARGQPIDEPKISANFLCSYNKKGEAERFVRYPGVMEKLFRLEHDTHFSELFIKGGAGLSLSQQKSFATLDLDVCRETFRTMGEIGQVLFEAF